MDKKLIECGKIVAPQGLNGQVRVQPWCDDPGLLCSLKTLYILGGSRQMTVEHARIQKNVVVLKLAGVDTLLQAEELRNHVLYMERAQMKLPRGTFFIADLIGLRVVDADSGKLYGTLCQVTPTGARDVYHLKTPDGRELLFPAIGEVILKTDPEAGVMEIRPLKGLFEDED